MEKSLERKNHYIIIQQWNMNDIENNYNFSKTKQSLVKVKRSATIKFLKLQWREAHKNGRQCIKTSSGNSVILPSVEPLKKGPWKKCMKMVNKYNNSLLKM